MLGPSDILRLARIYAEAERIALSTVGERAAKNAKLFVRLAAGHDATARSLLLAESFFRANWPCRAEWPADITPKPPRVGRARRSGAQAGCAP